MIITNDKLVFNNIVMFYLSYSSFWLWYNATKNWIIKWYTKEDYIVVDWKSNVTNKELHFFPYHLLSIISQDSRPTEIELIEKRLSKHSMNNPSWLHWITWFLWNLIMSNYSDFYEKLAPYIKKKYWCDPKNRSDTLNFWRILRNCFSHWWVITIKSPKSNIYSRRTLSYWYEDNWKEILFNDLWVTNIIYLMIDLEKEV